MGNRSFVTQWKDKYQSLPIAILFSLLIVGLPLSKALLAIGSIGLLVLSLSKVFQFPFFISTRSHLTFLFLYLCFFTLVITQVSGTAPNDSRGWQETGTLANMLIMPWVCFAFREHLNKYWKRYVQLFFAATSLAATITIVLNLLPADTLFSLTQNTSLLQAFNPSVDHLKFGFYSPFIDRLQFSYILAGAFLLGLFLLKRFKRPRWIYLTMTITFLLLLVIGAKGAQIGIAGALLIWFMLVGGEQINRRFKTGHTSGRILAFSSFLLIGGTLAVLAFNFFNPIKTRYNQMKWELETYNSGEYDPEQAKHFTTVNRLYSWKYNLSLIREKPVFGWGLGSFYSEINTRYQEDEVIFPASSQNQYLYFWAVGGVLAFLFFVLSQYFWLLHLNKKHPSTGFFYAVIVFYFIIFLFDTPLQFTAGSGFYFFFISFLFIISNPESRIQDPGSS